MTTFSHQGKAHRMLAYLSDHPWSPACDLFQTTGADDRRTRSKAWRTLMAMIREDLVEVVDSLYRLTDEGWEALRILSLGQDYEVMEAAPSVRVFAPGAARIIRDSDSRDTAGDGETRNPVVRAA